jgi:hypothetical protein
MSDQAQPPTATVEKLLQADEGQLFEELGIRAKAIAADPAKAGQYDPEVTYEGAQMGALEDVRAFGMNLFRRVSVQAHEVVCSKDKQSQEDRKELLEAIGLNAQTAAAAIAALLVAKLGLAPAIAAVVAALIIKLFFRPAYDEFCRVWQKNLPEMQGS